VNWQIWVAMHDYPSLATPAASSGIFIPFVVHASVINYLFIANVNEKKAKKKAKKAAQKVQEDAKKGLFAVFGAH